MEKKRKDTRTDLVEELLKLKQYPEIKFMIDEAKAGEFHDYKNEKYVCGKAESYNRLKQLAFHYQDEACSYLADRIAEGEFDEEADEDDKAMMRKELAEDCGGENEQYKMLCQSLGL